MAADAFWEFERSGWKWAAERYEEYAAPCRGASVNS